MGLLLCSREFNRLPKRAVCNYYNWNLIPVWKRYYQNRTAIIINCINLRDYYIYMCINVFVFGMSGFTINHAMTNVAQVDIQPDASMGYFANNNVLITSILFMIIASFPFVLIISSFRGDLRNY